MCEPQAEPLTSFMWYQIGQLPLISTTWDKGRQVYKWSLSFVVSMTGRKRPWFEMRMTILLSLECNLALLCQSSFFAQYYFLRWVHCYRKSMGRASRKRRIQLCYPGQARHATCLGQVSAIMPALSITLLRPTLLSWRWWYVPCNQF